MSEHIIKSCVFHPELCAKKIKYNSRGKEPQLTCSLNNIITNVQSFAKKKVEVGYSISSFLLISNAERQIDR